jgi:ATP-dependent Clp protease protease subunit
MPIGVPRIIYSWGEELPAQWTDIYNFIFRRRMVFLMQYLDDELCNQICGLLINIHMEDRSKELEKNEVEGENKPRSTSSEKKTDGAASAKKKRSPEDLLNADEDLGIDDIDTLEQLTLQKITKEWLNWNSQFFDYSDEPYLYYLAQTLSKDFGNSSARSPYDFNAPLFFNSLKTNSLNLQNKKGAPSGKGLDIYSAFRTSSNPSNEGAGGYSLNDMHPLLKGSTEHRNVKKDQLLQMFKQGSNAAPYIGGGRGDTMKNKGISKFLLDLAGKDFASNSSNPQKYKQLSEKALGQRHLRREYNLDSLTSGLRHPVNKKAWTSSSNDSYNEFRDYYRKQTERSFMEEESKKVFVIINSFGGSVGNGITVHDALQFIKAGSLTLGLGVAASASSLVLAGGTIGERYVTEGCHTMIHQPESNLQGQASDIWIDSQEIMKIRLDVADIYSLSTYRPRHKILRDLDRDFYLNAPETIAYGLADEIATNEVMHEIVEMTSKIWDVYDGKQQRLLESRESASSGSETQTQS